MAHVIQDSTTKSIEGSQRVIDMAERIYMLDPDETPFTALLRKLSKRPTGNPEFSWLEDETVPVVNQINNTAGYSATATSLVVYNAIYFAPGDLVKVFRTNETMRVTAVTPSTQTITVTRGWGSTAAALNHNDFLYIMGPAYQEGAPVGTSRMTRKVKVHNYTEIFRRPFRLTGTLEASKLYGVTSERAYQRRKNAVEHNRSIERAFWFGARNEDLSGDPIRSTGGVLQYITTNKTSLANDAALTLPAFDAFWESVFAYGSGTRWAFVSPTMLTLINALGQTKLQLFQAELGKANNQTFGLRVTQYVSPHGVVNLVMTRIFKDYRSPASPHAAGKLLVALDFDPEDGVAYRYLQTRDTKLITDIQTPGTDAYMDEYLTECGLQVAQERRHGILEIRG